MNNQIFIDILNIIHIIREDILIPNGIEVSTDTRRWIPIYYGNRLGFLPYETDEEKEKIFNDHRFFGLFDKDGRAILTTYSDLGIKKEPIKKKGFKLEL